MRHLLPEARTSGLVNGAWSVGLDQTCPSGVWQAWAARAQPVHSLAWVPASLLMQVRAIGTRVSCGEGTGKGWLCGQCAGSRGVEEAQPSQLPPGTQAGGGGHLGRSSFEGAWGSVPRVQTCRALGLGAWGGYGRRVEVHLGLNVPVGVLSPGLLSGGWWTRWATWLTQGSLGGCQPRSHEPGGVLTPPSLPREC